MISPTGLDLSEAAARVADAFKSAADAFKSVADTVADQVREAVRLLLAGWRASPSQRRRIAKAVRLAAHYQRKAERLEASLAAAENRPWKLDHARLRKARRRR